MKFPLHKLQVLLQNQQHYIEGQEETFSLKQNCHHTNFTLVIVKLVISFLISDSDLNELNFSKFLTCSYYLLQTHDRGNSYHSLDIECSINDHNHLLNMSQNHHNSCYKSLISHKIF